MISNNIKYSKLMTFAFKYINNIGFHVTISTIIFPILCEVGVVNVSFSLLASGLLLNLILVISCLMKCFYIFFSISCLNDSAPSDGKHEWDSRVVSFLWFHSVLAAHFIFSYGIRCKRAPTRQKHQRHLKFGACLWGVEKRMREGLEYRFPVSLLAHGIWNCSTV